MALYVITVDIRVAEGKMAAFMPLIAENAKRSLADEDGCRHFDILVPLDNKDGDRLMLYEIYDDETAFEAHRKTEHYRVFQQAARPMIAELKIHRFDVVRA